MGMPGFRPPTPYGMMFPYLPPPYALQYPPCSYYPPPFMTPYPAGPYGPAPSGPQQYPGQPPGQYAGQPPVEWKQPRKKMGTGKLVLIIVIVLLVIGGGIAAAVLLTSGKSGSGSFSLGDASVVGANIKFRNVTLKQSGNSLTLSGRYDNKSKRKGTVYVTVEATGKGASRTINFTVPVSTGTGKSFTKKQTNSGTISEAALGTLIFQGSSDSEPSDGNVNPWDDSQSVPNDSDGTSTPSDTLPPGWEESIPDSPYSSPTI